MLHYPYFKEEGDDFFQCQKNLTDYCIEKIGDINGKKVLEIGCGNGIQALYIMEKYKPSEIIGVDLNEDNIKIAQKELEKRDIKNVRFIVGNAQELFDIDGSSIDIVLNIESAFHYPDKKLFIEQIHKVLIPGKKFVIADIIKKSDKKRRNNVWKKRMHFNHWSELDYRKTFQDVGLNLDSVEDITDHVVVSFYRCIEWFKKSGVIKNVFVRIWGMIMLRLNAHLLKKKQSYYIFVGSKPMD